MRQIGDEGDYEGRGCCVRFEMVAAWWLFGFEMVGVDLVWRWVISFGGRLCYSGPFSSSLALFYEFVG
jgi:hypothetical protein